MYEPGPPLPAKAGSLLQEAGRRFRAGDLDGAIAAMQQLNKLAPQSPRYHNDLGILYAARREPAQAERCYRKAIELRPDYAAAHLNLGNALRDQGRWPEAVAAYQRAADLAPQLPQAHHALATALRITGRLDDAVAQYQRALQLSPDSPELYNDLGRTRAQQGLHEQAIDCFRTAIRLRPQYPLPYRNLGALLMELGRAQEAADIFANLVRLDATSAAAHNQLGAALARAGRASEAVAPLRRSVELDPNFGPAWCNLALALEQQESIEDAREALGRARRLMPNSAVVAYHCGALGAGPAPPACPPQYLVELFDAYAATFNQHLFERLAYRGPQLLLAAFASTGRQRAGDVADLGCGTGAAGPLFRPIAASLTGVDLSPRMLDVARQRDTYDKLVQSDIVAFLLSNPRSFDLLLAADVFIYIGDLREVFAAAAGSLRPSGLFAFTIETTDEADYVLRPTRRYAQSIAYIQRLAREAGFQIAHQSDTILRAGEGPRVAGAVFLLCKA